MKSNKTIEYIKANRRGSREAELENSNGWKSNHLIKSSKKQYNRKKYKINLDY